MLTPERFEELLNGTLAGDIALSEDLYLRFFQKELSLLQKQQVIDRAEAEMPSNVHAYTLRAMAHFYGLSAALNDEEGFTLLDTAIGREDADAMYHKANILLGYDNPDYATIIPLLEQSSLLGHDGSIYLRACLHRDAKGGPANDQTAMILFSRAQSSGNIFAADALAGMFDAGQGILPEHSVAAIRAAHLLNQKAITGYERLIKSGNSCGMYARAMMHADGRGGPRDVSEAVRLYHRASLLHLEFAKNALDSLKADGTVQQIKVHYEEEFLLPAMTLAAANLPPELIDNIIQYLALLTDTTAQAANLGTVFGNDPKEYAHVSYARICSSFLKVESSLTINSEEIISSSDSEEEQDPDELIALISTALANEAYWENVIGIEEEYNCIDVMRKYVESQSNLPSERKLLVLQETIRRHLDSDFVTFSPNSIASFCKIILFEDEKALSTFIQEQAADGSKNMPPLPVLHSSQMPVVQIPETGNRLSITR
jgi:hypothetical protein